MKKLITAGILGLAISAIAQAEDTTGNSSGFYLGGGIASIGTDAPSDPDNYFFQAGYSFSGGWAAELLYTDSYNDADLGTFEFDGIDIDMTLSASAIAAYAVYRSSGDLYFKGKLGYIDAEMELSGSAMGESASETESETDYSYGIGGGYSFGAHALELEYTTTGDDINWDIITFGYKYQF
jgi:outer membrane immunogenic protein